MSSEWFPFTDLLSAIVDNRGRTCPVGEVGVPLIATNCVDRSNLYPSYVTNRFVSEDTYKTWFRGHPQPGDILFVCKGSPGRTNWVPDPVDFCIAQDMVAVRADPAKVYPKYLFAALRSSVVQAQIDNMHVGSMIPHFKKGDFGKLRIPVPTDSAQREIGDLYFTLCERIATLRETNTTLEAIAQALFKSWFVDFDPVRAKQQGNAPQGMDAATAALFPDSFEASELGEVPKGWRVKSLDTIAEYLNGLALQKFPPEENNWLPVIKISQLRKGDTTGADRANRNLKPEYIIQNGDVLFSWSGSLEVIIWCGGEGALNQHLFKVTSADYPKWFYYLWTKHHLANFQQIAESKATTMGHIQRKHLTEAKVVVPPADFVAAANAYFEPLIERWIATSIQAQTLATLRDTLLPRLISGQLRLPA